MYIICRHVYHVICHHVIRHRDPGYWSTSRLILETGLCLALGPKEGEEEREWQRQGGGVMTPAAACGVALIDRLRKAGFVWEVLPLVVEEAGEAAAGASSSAAGGLMKGEVKAPLVTRL